MKKYVISALFAAAAAAVSAPATAATTLNFASSCGGVCAAYGTVSQNYGDIAGVLDVSYRSVTSSGSTTSAGVAYTWSAGYGDFASAIWGAQGGALEIAFNVLDPNKKITLNSVSYAAYSGLTIPTQLAVYSTGSMAGFYLPMMPSGALTAPGQGHATWSPNVTSSNGFVLHFGPDGFNAGIGEISFTISDIAATSPIPEPSIWLSMLLGFGLVGAVTRRAKRKSLAVV